MVREAPAEADVIPFAFAVQRCTQCHRDVPWDIAVPEKGPRGEIGTFTHPECRKRGQGNG